jgi:flavin reductase (DIM6/NTAB) family NADH-FMN oxidoreductase RutF
MSFDSAIFRSALGYFATGVTIITTTDESGAPIGITANSFTSLSLDPPLVLFCLGRKAMSFEAFHRNRHFAVNVLSETQQALSSTFATSHIDKWSGVAFEVWETGCPVFDGCLANFECDLDSIFEGGDHVILIGKVRAMRVCDDGARPLLFYRGRYSALSAG